MAFITAKESLLSKLESLIAEAANYQYAIENCGDLEYVWMYSDILLGIQRSIQQIKHTLTN